MYALDAMAFVLSVRLLTSAGPVRRPSGRLRRGVQLTLCLADKAFGLRDDVVGGAMLFADLEHTHERLADGDEYLCDCLERGEPFKPQDAAGVGWVVNARR